MSSRSSDDEPSAPRAITERRPRSGRRWGSIIEPMILSWKLFWDERVGLLPKSIPVVAAIYVISPVDFIPELALGPIGALDDVGVVLLALNVFVAMCPPDIVDEYRRQLGYIAETPIEDGQDVVDGKVETKEDR